MGEFFAASADEVYGSGVPPAPADAVAADGVGESGVAALGEIVGAGLYDELLARLSAGGAPALGEAEAVTLPRKFRDALAETGNPQEVADRWQVTEELAAAGWEPEDALELVERLTQLARDARERDLDLCFRWPPTAG